MKRAEPIRLAEILRQTPGKWVAVKGGVAVDVRDTPYELVMALKERGITGATIVRAPGEQEPELVGLG